jgi:hypothetical protein
MRIMPIRSAASLAIVVLALAGCGGSSSPAPSDPVQEPRFTLSEAVPGEHVGSLSVVDATRVSTVWREPDGFSADPYCVVRYSSLLREQGMLYDIVVAYRASDRRVLAVTVNQFPTSWFVAAFNPSASEASVDSVQRIVRLHKVRSTQGGQVGWQATVEGSASFPAAPQTSACG